MAALGLEISFDSHQWVSYPAISRRGQPGAGPNIYVRWVCWRETLHGVSKLALREGASVALVTGIHIDRLIAKIVNFSNLSVNLGYGCKHRMFDSIKILVLNYSYEPLQFCTAKRGIIMVLSGRAENLESNGYVVRSPSLTYPLPAVIRVLKLIRRNRKRGVSFSKKNILRRDNYTCQYCGHSGNILTVDHVHPKSRGGKTSWTNVVVACKSCNLKKGNQSLIETGMQLITIPSKPDFLFSHFSIPSGPESHVEIWQKYLPAKIFQKFHRHL